MNHPGWRATFDERTMSARAALTYIRSGSRVFVAAGCGRPQALVDELVNLPRKLADIELIHLTTLGLAPYASSEYKDRFRHNALVVGSEVSEAMQDGRADFTPIGKFRIAKLIRSRRIPIDVAMIQVSPPNELGYVSMGITVGISKTAAECARYVVAEVNTQMPRTLGDSFLHVSQIDAFVMADHPLVEAPPLEVNAIDDTIARHCARLFEDNATIHIGYGSVLYALPKYLMDRRDLGVHTDVLTPPLVELIRKGVVTNVCKNLNNRKTIASLCYGSKEIYDFVSDNPQIEFHPCEYVNNPFIIAQHDRMIAVSEGQQVDLTGMVCARFVGPRFGSGFMQGASYARRGKSIITLPSTTPDGKASNVVMHIRPGSGIAQATNRNEVQYVVTEYGIADLYGKTIRERALALIHIAHPKFRQELMGEAKENRLVHADQLLSQDAVYPDHFESTLALEHGAKVLVRPAVPSDERMVQSFAYGMDEQDLRYRFHGELVTMHHERVQHLVNVDYETTMSLLALLPGEEGEEEVVGFAQYLRYEGSARAEVAFLTAPKFRNVGVGTLLLRNLIKIARQKGIETFFAEVLRQNRQMLQVFHKGNVPLISVFEDGAYNVTLDLTQEL